MSVINTAYASGTEVAEVKRQFDADFEQDESPGLVHRLATTVTTTATTATTAN